MSLDYGLSTMTATTLNLFTDTTRILYPDTVPSTSNCSVRMVVPQIISKSTYNFTSQDYVERKTRARLQIESQNEPTVLLLSIPR